MNFEPANIRLLASTSTICTIMFATEKPAIKACVLQRGLVATQTLQFFKSYFPELCGQFFFNLGILFVF